MFERWHSHIYVEKYKFKFINPYILNQDARKPRLWQMRTTDTYDSLRTHAY